MVKGIVSQKQKKAKKKLKNPSTRMSNNKNKPKKRESSPIAKLPADVLLHTLEYIHHRPTFNGVKSLNREIWNKAKTMNHPWGNVKISEYKLEDLSVPEPEYRDEEYRFLNEGQTILWVGGNAAALCIEYEVFHAQKGSMGLVQLSGFSRCALSQDKLLIYDELRPTPPLLRIFDIDSSNGERPLDVSNYQDIALQDCTAVMKAAFSQEGDKICAILKDADGQSFVRLISLETEEQIWEGPHDFVVPAEVTDPAVFCNSSYLIYQKHPDCVVHIHEMASASPGSGALSVESPYRGVYGDHNRIEIQQFFQADPENPHKVQYYSHTRPSIRGSPHFRLEPTFGEISLKSLPGELSSFQFSATVGQFSGSSHSKRLKYYEKGKLLATNASVRSLLMVQTRPHYRAPIWHHDSNYGKMGLLVDALNEQAAKEHRDVGAILVGFEFDSKTWETAIIRFKRPDHSYYTRILNNRLKVWEHWFIE